NQPASKLALRSRPPSPPKEHDPFEDLLTNPDVSAKPVVKETLYLYVSPEQFSATYDIYLPKDHPLFVTLLNNYLTTQVDTLVNEILGGIAVKGRPLQFKVADISIDPEDA